MTHVWLPEPSEAYDDAGGLPDGLDIEVYDGAPGTPLPESTDRVRFYVTPYLMGNETLEPISTMSRLEVVQTLTAGVEHVRPYLRPGTTLCNARGVHDASTAELAVGMMLTSLRGFGDFIRAQERREWRHGQYASLADRTVLIVGYGAIGQALERRLDGFECNVLRVARTARDGVAGLDELPELLPQADVVVLLLPMTAETRGTVDAKFLARMKDGALLVNVARGGIVDTEALLAELTDRRLTAALDVTDPEPLPSDHPLWSAPGLLLTPHVGGNTSAYLPRARRLIVQQLRRFVAGEPLHNVVSGAY